jgi:hypothetical protein
MPMPSQGGHRTQGSRAPRGPGRVTSLGVGDDADPVSWIMRYIHRYHEFASPLPSNEIIQYHDLLSHSHLLNPPPHLHAHQSTPKAHPSWALQSKQGKAQRHKSSPNPPQVHNRSPQAPTHPSTRPVSGPLDSAPALSLKGGRGMAAYHSS